MAYLRENIKKLGFGLMRLPKLEGDVIDIEQTKNDGRPCLWMQDLLICIQPGPMQAARMPSARHW